MYSFLFRLVFALSLASIPLCQSSLAQLGGNCGGLGATWPFRTAAAAEKTRANDALASYQSAYDAINTNQMCNEALGTMHLWTLEEKAMLDVIYLSIGWAIQDASAEMASGDSDYSNGLSLMSSTPPAEPDYCAAQNCFQWAKDHYFAAKGHYNTATIRVGNIVTFLQFMHDKYY